MRERGETSLLNGINKIHFVGIGGAGMSAIAKILVEKGFQVSGSDLHDSEILSKLKALGATIFYGQKKENITGVDAIVVSTAISEENPEVIAAKENNIKIFHRSDIVATLMNKEKGIAVAGAHGKTTTTSMIGVMLDHAGVEPSIIIGGEVDYLGSNAKLGNGEYLVAEADESDGSFLKLLPDFAIVTNIENDHMDFYGTMENILKTFEKFLNNLPKEHGLAILCFNNSHIKNIAKTLDRKYVSYAIDGEADYVAKNITTNGAETSFEVYHRGHKIGLSFTAMAAALRQFNGAKRRFQTKGRIADVWVVDDYAHHPTELSTTLAAARQTKPKRLICVFQPHRYSRTQLLLKEFGVCFDEADVLILTDIYSAGESPIEGVSGETIKVEVENHMHKEIVYIADRKDIAPYLSEAVQAGDLVMTMGAGDIYLTGEELVALLNKK
jgi:UDP-N-acetylmuramate--alanine ligase